MQSESGRGTRWGGADTYDRDRNPRKEAKFNDKRATVYAEHFEVEIIEIPYV